MVTHLIKQPVCPKCGAIGKIELILSGVEASQTVLGINLNNREVQLDKVYIEDCEEWYYLCISCDTVLGFSEEEFIDVLTGEADIPDPNSEE
jgi:hypothetical protein